MANIGDYWKKKLKLKLLPVLFDMTVHQYSVAPTKCPGGWTSNSSEFDSEADFLYHSDNPAADVCRNGLIGEVVETAIHGFYSSSLTESQMTQMEIGTLDENEGVFICDGYTDLTNVICIEYPAGTYHSIIFQRDMIVADVVIAKYAKLRKSNGVL